MLKLPELQLIAEFVDASLATGIIKTASGVTNAAKVIAVLQREVAEVQAIDQANAAARKEAAYAEIQKLRDRANEAEDKLAALQAPPTPTSEEPSDQIELLPVEQACGGQAAPIPLTYPEPLPLPR